MIWEFLSIFLSGSAFGGAWLVRCYLHPRSLEDSAEHYLNFHQQILGPIDRYLVIASLLSALAASGILVHHHVWVYLPTKLIMEGLICSVLAIILLFVCIRPMDRKFAGWQMDSLPEDWPRRRIRWLRSQTAQTILSFLAFTFYLLGALMIDHVKNI